LDLNLGYSLQEILSSADPVQLILQLDQAPLKLKLLEEYRNWTEVLTGVFLKEQNARVMNYLYETLLAEAPQQLAGTLDTVLQMPHKYAAAVSWMCQRGEQQGLDLAHDLVGQRLTGKFLISVLNVIDDSEFSSHKNRIKKALESGLLMNILAHPMEPETAKKAIALLEHSTSIEDYRRDRWIGVIRVRFPEFKEKQEWIFSTKEAVEKKRAELENLITVELPKNRKAVGEAAALGDLSENHEYKAARERQEYLINRVQQLQDDLNKVRVLEPGQTESSEVRPGTRVTLAKDGTQVSATILGPWDSNPQENIYSYQSPMGAALLGKSVGDEVNWNDSAWKIAKIEPW
jgi:transcription elongation factor GreA